MHNEHLRPAFEVWAADYFTHPDKSKAISLSCGEEVLQKDGDGNYFWLEIHDSWETWCAAHEAFRPEGYVVVPVFPTVEMVKAAIAALEQPTPVYQMEQYIHMYQVMVNVAKEQSNA